MEELKPKAKNEEDAEEQRAEQKFTAPQPKVHKSPPEPKPMPLELQALHRELIPRLEDLKRERDLEDLQHNGDGLIGFQN